MDALILAGGMGTRLKSVVNDRPKPMALVAGKPFVEWLLTQLRDQGIRRFIFCTGHSHEKIEEYFGAGTQWNVEILYSREPVALGTGGAIRLALSRSNDRNLLVLNGDSFCRFDIESLMKEHSRRAASATMWLAALDDCSRFGAVEMDANNQISRFVEKGQGAGKGLINAGIYVLERTLIEALPENVPVSLELEIFPKLINRGLYGLEGSGPFIDIGTPESYDKADLFMKRYAG